jgi:signal transduction histidine kinase
MVDKNNIFKVINHLIDNAIKFTPDNGNITFEVQPISENKIEIRIEDSGIGIELEKQNKIFEAFVQADTSSTRNYEGVGLGLTVASRIVQKWGSTLIVKSEIDQGSIFSFTF